MSEFVRKYLDISTAHIPPDLLEAAGGGELDTGPHRCEAVEYGWVVFLADAEIDPGDDDTPDWFQPIVKLARREGCQLVTLDMDADVHPDLRDYTE